MIFSNASKSNPAKAIVERLSGMHHKYILSFGAFNDTSLASLSKLGHNHLYGIDSNKRIYDMPDYTQVKYSYSPMDNTHFPKSFFEVVYNLNSSGYFSNMESLKGFLQESQRILSDKGTLLLFISSSNFSKADVEEIIRHSAKLGFVPAQKEKLPDGEYSVLLEFTLSKKEIKNKIKQVNLVVASLGKGEGMDVCYQLLHKRFEEIGIKAPLYKSYDEVDKKFLTIIGYVPAYNPTYPRGGKFMIDAHQTQASSRFWIEVKNIIRDVIKNPIEFFRIMKIIIFHFGYAFQTTQRLKTNDNKELGEHFLILRTNELAQASGFKDYTIMPLAAFGTPIKSKKPKEIHIGSFGFATKGKHFDQICELAKRLGIKATIWMGASRMNNVTESTTNYLAQDIYDRYNSKMISVRAGEYTEEQLIKGMKECTHFISAQGDAMVTSASLRHMILMGRPVISVDNYISKEAQIHRVNSLDDITLEYLRKTTELTNLDDGFRYLLKILEHVDFSEDFKPK